MCLNAGAMGRQDAESETLIPTSGGYFDVAHSLRGEGFDASEDGTGRGTPLVPVTAGTLKANNGGGGWSNSVDHAAAGYMVPVAIQERAVCQNQDAGTDGAGFRADGMAYTLEARTVPQAVAFAQNQRGEVLCKDIMDSLKVGGGKPGQGYPAVGCFKRGQGSAAGTIGYDENLSPTLNAADSGSNRTPTFMTGMQVRRLTPRECERLQGFPDDYTLVPFCGKPAADGNRYKALGNSMAVPVMRWIGECINMVEKEIYAKES